MSKQDKKIVCVDTNVLIWGVSEKKKSEDPELFEATKSFFQKIKSASSKQILVLPAPVVAEFLVGGDEPNKIESSLNDFEGFEIAPFDVAAAKKYAEIFSFGNQKRKNGKYEKSRNCFKLDCAIIAIAVSIRASCIYSQDKDVGKLASDHIKVLKIPDSQLKFK